MTTGERIKQLRKEMSLTQEVLADRLSIGHSTLACYETDRRQIPHGILVAMAKLFDVSTDYLLGLKDF